MALRAYAVGVAFAGVVLLAACSKVTQENFGKIQDGMDAQEVQALLGTPTESSDITVLGLSATSSKWIADERTITVQFVNGKVRAKWYEARPAR
jgi:hypothetical protein